MLILYAKVLAFLFGIVWCGAIFRRLPADVREFREAAAGEGRAAIVTYWIVTIPVFLWVVGFAWGLLSGMFRLLA